MLVYNPHFLLITTHIAKLLRRAAADYTNVHRLTTLQLQYIGTVGSTLSEYACIPPSKLLSCVKPSDCKYSAACWDLMPWWHIKIVCLNGSSSLVTVRPQSRILQFNLCCVQVSACMPSLVRKQCQTVLRTGNHETGFSLMLKYVLMRTMLSVLCANACKYQDITHACSRYWEIQHQTQRTR